MRKMPRVAATLSFLYLVLCGVTEAICGGSSSGNGSCAHVEGSEHLCVDKSRPPYYFILVDGGSTGSRLHIFHFVEDKNGLSSGTTYTCQREGSSRANVPLSAFAPPSSATTEELIAGSVAAHLLPLFEYAAQVIPEEHHNTTVVKYQATAGMRLLTDQQQEAVYDALYEGLMDADTFSFRGMKRDDIGTLSGDLEGYYGAVAANYLSGIIDVNLHVVANNNNAESRHGTDTSTRTTHPIGALDMGGSSTQIVYLTEQIDNGSHSCSLSELPQNSPGLQEETESMATGDGDDDEFPQTCRLSDFEGKTRLQGDSFFSTSYLSYGVDQFRERLWDELIDARQMEDHSDSCDTKVIAYPCGFKGHKSEWRGYTLFGTGDANECTKEVQRLLPHPEKSIDNHHEHTGRTVGGIEHPPVRGKFFAMSLYFFTLDSLRVLSHPKVDAHDALNSSWPRPTIEELTDALEGLCTRSWVGDLKDIQHDAHQFTRAEVLPHRCFESVYMISLLRDGFGFHPQSRDITFTFLVDGSEVEWTLGMAIALFSETNALNQSEGCTARCPESASPLRNTTKEWRRDREDILGHLLSPLSSIVTNSG